ncbi:acyl-CoA oxidase [Ramaria rubella]|nr:acyl-CoA oxidase [Ramaria rubella]
MNNDSHFFSTSNGQDSDPHNRQMMLMNAARSTASFDSRKLAYIIYGGEDALEIREHVLTRVEGALGEADTTKLPRLYREVDRSTAYYEGLRFGKIIMEEGAQHRHNVFESVTHRFAPLNASPFGLHAVMFIPTLKLQASPEQLAYWLPQCESGKIIGTYCQTELGHGTFVRGLETTATFDPATDGFILHSPTVSSTKYWPGGLGYSCSHAIVMARLIIHGRDYGVHPFMTQLRSLEDWSPLKGIELGDIGLTMGLNSIDNGYAIFTHVRIPRHHMLMGNSKVLADGTYISAPHNKLTYSTMIYTRNGLIQATVFPLAQAVVIAVRYSMIREQGQFTGDGADPGEVSIMAYKSQHYRLLSILSRAFALFFASRACDEIYQDLVARQNHGDHSTLAYGHMITASLKAFGTQTAADDVEDARKCCGGHGFSSLSGLPEIVSLVTPMATLEGENFVMFQQTARYLVKCAAAIRNGRPVDAPMSYLVDGYQQMLSSGSSRCQAEGSDFLKLEVQLCIFKHRAVRLTFECEEALREAQAQEGVSPSQAWNAHMMDLIMAARAHAQLFVLQSFGTKIALVDDGAIRKVLNHLCNVFALVAIESPFSIGSIGFFEDGYICQLQLRTIRGLLNQTLEQLLPEAVGLTDAWSFSDVSLQSALGRRDGNVYETLLSWTKQTPLNQRAAASGGVDREGFETYIRPIIQGSFKSIS